MSWDWSSQLIVMSKLFQNEAEAEFTGLMNTTDEIVTAVADTKIKDDDIDLALDALRNCDTDFIKFDEVFIFILYMNSLICYLNLSLLLIFISHFRPTPSLTKSTCCLVNPSVSPLTLPNSARLYHLNEAKMHSEFKFSVYYTLLLYCE